MLLMERREGARSTVIAICFNLERRGGRGRISTIFFFFSCFFLSFLLHRACFFLCLCLCLGWFFHLHIGRGGGSRSRCFLFLLLLFHNRHSDYLSSLVGHSLSLFFLLFGCKSIIVLGVLRDTLREMCTKFIEYRFLLLIRIYTLT